MSEESPVILYRCQTPTNMLCPCGAVARRLQKLGVEHETERVPQRRGRRPEIEELTGQRRVPVIVDGAEVIHDSKRIIEYLDWRYGGDQAEAADERDDEDAEDAEDEKPGRRRPRRLYNVKRWKRRETRSR